VSPEKAASKAWMKRVNSCSILKSVSSYWYTNILVFFHHKNEQKNFLLLLSTTHFTVSAYKVFDGLKVTLFFRVEIFNPNRMVAEFWPIRASSSRGLGGYHLTNQSFVIQRINVVKDYGKV
jgi:hypothetical protein